MKNLQDKVVAITGAGSGIGRATALECARLGAHVAITDINLTGVEETAQQVRALGVKVVAGRLDVTDKAAVHAWADATAQEFGKVNVIINNAGVALGATVEEMKYEDFEWLMNINFWGVVYGTKAFLPHLVASGEGHVVNISSIFGLIGVPSQSAYNAAKFAVRGFTESLREELDIARNGVSATCVHPGGIRTNIATSARMGGMGGIGGGGEKARTEFNKFLRIPPEEAARQIIAGVRNNSRRVLIGPEAVATDLMQRLLPTGYQRLLATGSQMMNKRQG